MSTDDKDEPKKDELLGELVDALEQVDENAPKAELNATTFDDKNGGRVELDKSKLQGRPPVQGIFTSDRTFRKIDPES